MKKNGLVLCGLLAAFPALVLADSPKAVEKQYRFSGGSWLALVNTGEKDNPDWEIGEADNANFTLDKNTLTITVDGKVIASYTGVYTAGGGTYTIDGDSGPWAYLYAASGKIGVAFVGKDHYGSHIMAILGKTPLAITPGLLSGFGITAAGIAGMQDKLTGVAYNE